MIRVIAAIDNNGGIGRGGMQPWDIPSDLAYFAHMTKQYGARVIYGSRTFKSLPGLLTDRTNYLATTQSLAIKGVTLVPDAAMFLRSQAQDLWVIGGGMLYALAIELGVADELYVTHIHQDFHCDTFFPDYYNNYDIISEGETCTQNGYIYQHNVYHKRE
jgi:dihydrofolate reductase